MKNRKKTALGTITALAVALSPACAEKTVDTKASPGAEAKAEAFKRLSSEEVAAKINDAKAGKLKLYIFDNNDEEQFKKARVPGAKWVKFDEVKESDLPTDKAATLVFYCANEQCTACHTGAMAAVKLGYKNVFIMPEGIRGWQKANKPTENS